MLRGECPKNVGLEGQNRDILSRQVNRIHEEVEKMSTLSLPLSLPVSGTHFAVL